MCLSTLLHWDEASILRLLGANFPPQQSPFLPGGYGIQCRIKALKPTPCPVSPQAKLLDSKARVTNWFNSSVTSLMETTPDGAPFSLLLRQDLVNAIVNTLVPKEELVILLRFVVSPAANRNNSPLRYQPTERSLRWELPIMINSALPSERACF